MMDLAKLAGLVANVLGGVSILAVVIMAAVAYLKQWGVEGKWLTGSAFVLGLVIALPVRYAMEPMVTFSDWVWAVMFGLMSGFLATGAYKVADGLAEKTGVLQYSGTFTHKGGNWELDPYVEYADDMGAVDDDEPDLKRNPGE